tara:strand:+ start:1500 stop:2147 length:648 start_codon:yes stop_codon:yes gene_type:complete
MAETFTMKEAPVNSEVLNSDEQDSLAVAESLEQQEQGEQQLLAGKFKDTQALEQAYVELQKKLGEPRDEVQTTEDEGEPAEDEPEAEATDDDPEGLSEKQAEMLMDMVGGDKAYKAMLDWAAENFSKEEIEMYDGVMESGNANSIYYAIQALQARYNDSVGSDGQTLTGRGAADTDDSFKSQAELVAAMSDPRYDRDPAYRKDVMRRLENSDVEF